MLPKFQLHLIPLHIYGTTHRVLSYAYIPWHKYSTDTYNNNKKWISSLWFTILTLVFLLPVYDDEYTSEILDLLDSSDLYFFIGAIFLGLISHVDYLIMYKSSVYGLFLKTFDSSSVNYKTTVYIVDLIIFAGLIANLVRYHEIIATGVL